MTPKCIYLVFKMLIQVTILLPNTRSSSSSSSSRLFGFKLFLALTRGRMGEVRESDNRIVNAHRSIPSSILKSSSMLVKSSVHSVNERSGGSTGGKGSKAKEREMRARSKEAKQQCLRGWHDYSHTATLQKCKDFFLSPFVPCCSPFFLISHTHLADAEDRFILMMDHCCAHC